MSNPFVQRQRAPPQTGDTLVVIHDFDARSSDELTLRKTDQIELLELDDGFGDGWYLGRHLGLGTTGLFPGGKLLPHQASQRELTCLQSTLQNFPQTSLLLAPRP